jgi:phosphate transport system substrate-binding protein
VLGVAIGYFSAGPLAFNNRIRELNNRITELEDLPAELIAMQREAEQAQGYAMELEDEVSDLEAEIAELTAPVILTGNLRLGGSTTAKKLLEALGDNFTEDNPEVTVRVEGGGSATGIKSAAEGNLDLGCASRNMKATETVSYSELTSYSLCKDALAVIVNPDNPVAGSLDLSLDDLVKIYTGEITNWNDLGGDNEEISAYTREAGSGTRDYFESTVLNGERFDPGVKSITGDQALKEKVAEEANAIAILSTSQLDATVEAVEVAGSTPSETNLNDGSYPLIRVIKLYVRRLPDENEVAFLDFITKEKVKKTIESRGFIPLN